MAKLPDLSEAPEMYEGWRQVFELKRIDHDSAERGSVLLLCTKHYPKDHFEALVKQAQEAKYGPYAARLDGAADASKSCPDCYGEGRAHVVDRETRLGFAVPCACDLGRVLLADERRRVKPGEAVMDLASIRGGQTYRAVIRGRAVTLDFSEHDAGPKPEPIHDPEPDYARWW